MMFSLFFGGYNCPNALLTGPTEQSKLVVKFAQQTTSLRRVVGSEYSNLLQVGSCKELNYWLIFSHYVISDVIYVFDPRVLKCFISVQYPAKKRNVTPR